jgi:hypothetical protein
MPGINVITLELYRENSKETGTKGTLMLGDKEICSMFELPWLENAKGKSCIPPGRYEVTYLKRSASGKYKDVYHVQNVPGRTGILIHLGNWAGDTDKGFKSDTDGCLLPASGFTVDENRQLMGYDSKSALQAIHDATKRDGFILEIYGL